MSILSENEVGDSIQPKISPEKSALNPFASQLNYLNKQYCLYKNKIAEEKKLLNELDQKVLEAKANIYQLQQATRGGVIVTENSQIHKKTLSILVKQLDALKVKHSNIKHQNRESKERVDFLRKDHFKNLKIIQDLRQEQNRMKLQIKKLQREIKTISDKKQATEIASINLKHKILQQTNEMMKEVQATKKQAYETQDTVAENVKMAVESNFKYTPHSDLFKSHTFSSKRDSMLRSMHHDKHSDWETTSAVSPKRKTIISSDDIQELLRSNGIRNIDIVINRLNDFEEQIFSYYTLIQRKCEEWEQNETEIRKLEEELARKELQIEFQESRVGSASEESARRIHDLQYILSSYKAEYESHTKILNSLAEHLKLLFSRLAMEDDHNDVQLLLTGVNDRNIGEYLGVIEKRIDDLIMMANAANHQPLKREDFIPHSTHHRKMWSGFRPPVLPAADEDFDDINGNVDDIWKLQPVQIEDVRVKFMKKVKNAAKSKKF